MNHDALRAVWVSDQETHKENLMTVVNAVLAEDRAALAKDRWMQVAGLIAVGLLCPVLLWFAANGISPLVRGGYALMAAGTGLVLFASWLHRTWSREALPGTADARSELQKIGLVVSRQASLVRTAPIWCGPIFIGAALVGAWIYQERSATGGYFLWAFVGAAWVMNGITGLSKARKLALRRARIEAVLSEFDSSL
jgi:hypothetical protein